MPRLRVQRQDETATDVTLTVILETDDGKSYLGVERVTLSKTANTAQVQAAILQARNNIRAAPVGGVVVVAKAIADRINSGDIP